VKRLLLVLGALVILTAGALGQNDGTSIESQRALVNQYCVGCHNDRVKSGGFSWTTLDLARPDQNAKQAEKVIRKLRAGMMPPAAAPRPDSNKVKALAAGLEIRIDEAAATQPYIDAPDLHRVNRTEYRNSVRDLLGMDVDATALLPPDARSGAFDNMASALTVTPALMQAYVRAAEKISREAVGDRQASAAMATYKIPKTVNQMRHIDGTPFGTRGGISVMHRFLADGEYTFKIDFHYGLTGQLISSRLPEPLQGQQVEISIDGERVAIFKIDPDLQEDQGPLESAPIKIKAGERRVAAAFISKFEGPLPDQYRVVEFTLLSSDIGNRPQMTSLPHLRTLSITGPFNASGVSESISRQKIFTCRPGSPNQEESCATQIISRLARQAFRRPVSAEDVEGLMVQYRAGREKADFEAGIRTAVQAILADPQFVFRFERVPGNVKPGQVFPISDLDLASRLSYFLWSSAPDDQLITLASQGKLKDPNTLERQVKRMLADPHSASLATNFARQWLRLQSIQDVFPEATLFPDYNRTLGESMGREVELLFESIMRENRSVLDLLTADYTFADEVLAKHYKLPTQVGPQFRRVQLTDPNRFGLIGKAGILTMTSLSNRTSPVARGKYVMEVLMGSPPPAPPPNVPKLKEAVENETVVSVRERMVQHRANEPCRSCHQMMDPIGLALENFDAVGLWRTKDTGQTIDPSGVMFDGMKLDGPASVRQALVNHSDVFIGTFTENLLSYGMGRVLDYRDMPAVRSIAREAAKNDYRFSAFILAITKSKSFQMTKNHPEMDQ
jgi:hypothetical protein